MAAISLPDQWVGLRRLRRTAGAADCRAGWCCEGMLVFGVGKLTVEHDGATEATIHAVGYRLTAPGQALTGKDRWRQDRRAQLTAVSAVCLLAEFDGTAVVCSLHADRRLVYRSSRFCLPAQRTI